MRASYVRAFYLPEHQPMPISITRQHKSQLPSHINSDSSCNCGREKEVTDDICLVCENARVIVQCTEKEKLLPEVVEMFKPVLCSVCNERFPDVATCEAHKRAHTRDKHPNSRNTNSQNLNPRTMKVSDLKKELQSRQLSTTGNRLTRHSHQMP